MTRLLGLVAAATVVALLTNWLGWHVVLVPLAGVLFLRIIIAHLFALGRAGSTGVRASDTPTPVAPGETVVYWCEDCGTELVLVTRGSGLAPRHCASGMHERTEVPVG